jgi:hypothetical protein
VTQKHLALLQASRSRRLATTLSFNEIQRMAHYQAVASEMIDTLREVCRVTAEQKTSIDPVSLLAWLDEHQTQLIKETAREFTDAP